jgi:Spy/CpxP family protein refolding chaperone
MTRNEDVAKASRHDTPTSKDKIMKKTWLKRTLLGVAVSTALLGSLAAYSAEGGGFHHGPPSAEEMAQHEATMLAHIGKTLSLDANQSAKLKALADQLHAQHAAMMGGAVNPHERMKALIAGNTFDRAGAQQLVNEKVQQIQTNSPALITAAGDFFDSLDATQQQQVRDFAAKHHGFGGHGHHGPHGASAPAGN